ncbi:MULTISPECIES: hypothetical protein [Burkholderia]|uniref:Uncharacterized protein n=2 Tax=Burkholderia humptydooensis TaxID=430531 RepID=A0A7U4P846_9BURK|nr:MULTISPECIES: hypothetical protein [Burkholderia]AGK49802.1 putative membrane protein [Burkholderia thailandensis MSMB121]ATF33758.1 hypothetical protein CO709_10970 [Burkholderia thailandensis]AJY40337.1 putative membrane protein [Burkholderia sp. 2002721687]ALX44749.1 hypothetical protein AQ610_19520 [Burkholderia humptydooensis]EIP86353.1 hypothetical protein A33K_17443 [Burkholderia humptydooensis MSMB43]
MKYDDDARRRDRSCDSGDRRAYKPAHVKAAMRMRGLVKVVCITIAVSQALTAAFAGLAHIAGHDVEAGPLLLFNFVTCTLVSYWLQSDAQRAYLDARSSGRLRSAPNDGAPLDVPADCPRRWLVILNIELNPHLLDSVQ